MIYIDVPQIAYRTWGIEYIIRYKNGNRDFLTEKDMENELKEKLSDYKFSSFHDHVKR